MLHIPARKGELKGSQGLKQTYGSYQNTLLNLLGRIHRTYGK